MERMVGARKTFRGGSSWWERMGAVEIDIRLCQRSWVQSGIRPTHGHGVNTQCLP